MRHKVEVLFLRIQSDDLRLPIFTEYVLIVVLSFSDGITRKETSQRRTHQHEIFSYRLVEMKVNDTFLCF